MVAVTITVISKTVLVYYCKWCNLLGYATRYLFVNIYRVAATNTARPIFSQKKPECLILVFRNNFKGITNTSRNSNISYTIRLKTHNLSCKLSTGVNNVVLSTVLSTRLFSHDNNVVAAYCSTINTVTVC